MARGFGATHGAGTGDVISSALTSNSTQRTWSVWSYRAGDGGGTNGRILAKGDAVGRMQLLNSAGVTQYQFVQDWSTLEGRWTIARPSADAWHSIVVTYDGGATTNDPIIYVDGASVTVTDSTVPAGTLTTNSEATQIGNRPALNANWDGFIAEVAVWDRLLSAAEAAALGKGFSPLFFPASLVEYVPLLRDNMSYKLAAPTVTGTAVQPHTRVIYRALPDITHVPGAAVAFMARPFRLCSQAVNRASTF